MRSTRQRIKGNLTPREAKLTQGDRLLQGLADSRELVRWAYDAKVGAISEIFPVGDDYVVAVVTEIDNEDYTPIEKVANNIRQTLITDKKFEKIVSEMKRFDYRRGRPKPWYRSRSFRRCPLRIVLYP